MNQAVLESKKNVVQEIQEKMANSGSSVVAEYRGLSVAEVTELRRLLRAEGAEMKVYKNTLATRAAEALVNLQIVKSIYLNPIICLLLFDAILCFLAAIHKKVRNKKIHYRLLSATQIIILLIWLSFSALRNLLLVCMNIDMLGDFY